MLPRRRALKVNEPERLNERHLAMIGMRAQGLHQRLIAKAFGDNDEYVSMVLNHPDAVFLLAHLSAMRAANGNDFKRRMEALSEPAMSAIEDALLADEPDTIKIALKRAPLAFRVLELNGEVKKPTRELDVNHNHRLDASPQQISLLREALREAKEVRDARYEVVSLPAPAEAGGLMPEGASEAPEASGGGEGPPTAFMAPSRLAAGGGD